MSSREKYVVVDGQSAPALVCSSIFGVLAGDVVSAVVDAYSDFTDQMPNDIRAAEQWLRGKGFARGDADPGVRIRVYATDEIGWAIVRAYAPWSVQVRLYDGAGRSLASIHDGSRSVMVDASDDEATLLAMSFGSSASLVRFNDWDPTGPSEADPEPRTRSRLGALSLLRRAPAT
jgi:hypothetical protein